MSSYSVVIVYGDQQVAQYDVEARDVAPAEAAALRLHDAQYPGLPGRVAGVREQRPSAKGQVDDLKVVEEAQQKGLEAMGLNNEEVARAMEPLMSFHDHIREDLEILNENAEKLDHETDDLVETQAEPEPDELADMRIGIEPESEAPTPPTWLPRRKRRRR